MKIKIVEMEPKKKNIALEVEIDGIRLFSVWYKNNMRNRVNLRMVMEELKNAKCEEVPSA